MIPEKSCLYHLLSDY